jgi:hypothetical protein
MRQVKAAPSLLQFVVPFSRSSSLGMSSTLGAWLHMAIELVDILLAIRRVLRVPCPLIALRVKEDDVVDMAVDGATVPGVVVGAAALPDDLRTKLLRSCLPMYG